MTERTETAASGFRAALAHRDFRYLLVSIAVSGIGDFMYSVAFVVWILRETDSATWVSVAMIMRLIPPALFGSVAGVFADRYDRRRLMIGLDLGMAACMGGLALLALGTGRGVVAAGIALTALNSLLTTPRRPAEAAITPRLVEEDDLAAANALQGAVTQVMWFAGPAIGALILAVSGEPAWAFAANAFTFLVSAALVSRVDPAHGAVIATVAPDADEAPSGVRAMWRDGIAAVRSTPGGVALLGLIAAVLLAYGFEVVLHVFVANEKLGLGESGLGFMTMFIGAGGLAAAPLTGRIARSRNPGALLVVSGTCLGLSLGGLAFTTSRPIAYALLVLEGVGNVIFEVLFATLIQRVFPSAVLGRVFGLSDSIGMSAMLLGTIAAPVLASMVSLEFALVVGGSVLVAWSILALPKLVTIGSGSVANMDSLAPVVARLERLALFQGAPLAALERAARASIEEAVPAGRVVITEGADPDYLYVIVSGDFDVHAESRRINTMTTDDWFGEIGLVENRPRTATVTASTDAVVLRIDGAEFLTAIEESSVVPEPLSRGIRVRLARTTLATRTQ